MKTDLSQIPTHKLLTELYKRKEILAVKVWSVDDIKSQAFENLGYDDEQTEEIAKFFTDGRDNREGFRLKMALIDCSADWEVIDSAIGHAAKTLGITPSDY